jgi:hypothetical protein
MKYTANIQAGDVTITVKQVNRVIIAIASGHCIAVSPDSAFYPLYFNRIEPSLRASNMHEHEPYTQAY